MGWSVQGEKIAQLVKGDQEVEAVQVIDLQGKVLLPGLVDDHVHFNQPGRTDWEGYQTGSMAAGRWRDYHFPGNAPQFIPVYVAGELLEQKRQAVKDDTVVDYGNWGGVGR